MTSIVPIIGGGPAGMSCALWLHNYGLHPLIVEQTTALGGMARRNPYPNPWLLGRPDALARENAEEFARHIRQIGVETLLDTGPRRLARLPDGSFVIELAEGRTLSSRALVIATGTEFRGDDWLDRVPNARALAARGSVLVGAAAVGEPGIALGTHVVLVGGGDNAFDVAHILSSTGVKVTIVMRSDAPHAQARLVDRVRGQVDVRAGCEVAALEDAGGSLSLQLSDGSVLAADHLVLLLGYRPTTHAPWLAELALQTDADGYFVVDGNMETSCPCVFAVGDVANPVHPCVATALATGTVAARELQKRLAPDGE